VNDLSNFGGDGDKEDGGWQRSGHALLALAARNALLVGWCVVAVSRLAKQSAPWRRLEAGAGTLPGPILPLRPRCDPPAGR
jgi:hypothetical protein